MVSTPDVTASLGDYSQAIGSALAQRDWRPATAWFNRKLRQDL